MTLRQNRDLFIARQPQMNGLLEFALCDEVPLLGDELSSFAVARMNQGGQGVALRSWAMKLDLIDVFGSRPLVGNPLAVVHGGDALDGAAMLALTQWLGFSETTFLLPPIDPEADYRVRIFYPGGELDFAGHPTLGSCHAWLAAGGKPKQHGAVVQQSAVGLISVRQDGDLLSFCAPPTRKGGHLMANERSELCRIAGVEEAQALDAVHVDNGSGFRLLRLTSAESVLSAEPQAKVPLGCNFGLIGPYADGGPINFEIRGFFADNLGRLVEDPVTGSLNASTAQFMFASGLARGSYIAAQGRKVGADGRVHCSIDAGGAVWVGGKVSTIANGADLAKIA
jgi:PhzF family phenazine biosynthesis protein